MWTVTFALLITGCATTGGEASSDTDHTVGLPASPGSSSSSGSSASAGPAGEFTLAFAGDVHFTGRTAPLLNNPATAFGPISSALSGADITMVNLETAVTSRGTPEPKTYHFRAPTTAYAAVAAAGVDAVSLANNHVLDYGQIGLLDTLDSAAAAGMPVFGAGRDAAQAYTPWITTVRGTRVAVIGLSQVSDLAESWAARDGRPGVAMAFDTARVRAAVQTARAAADVVIAFPHWGVEGDTCPSGRQKELTKVLVDAGVDIILGSHAHVLQGAGWQGRVFIAYGMGNFLWYSTSHSTDTGVLRLTIRGRSVVSADLVPAVVSATGQPKQLTGAAADNLQRRFAGLRACAGLAATAPAQ